MGITMILALAMAALLVCGVLVWLLAPAPAGGEAAVKNPLPLGVFVVCAVSLVGFVFYLASGYIWLAGVAGYAVGTAAFWAFSVAAPLLGTLACGVCFALNRRRLVYFLLAWGCLLLLVIGLGTLGLTRM